MKVFDSFPIEITKENLKDIEIHSEFNSIKLQAGVNRLYKVEGNESTPDVYYIEELNGYTAHILDTDLVKVLFDKFVDKKAEEYKLSHPSNFEELLKSIENGGELTIMADIDATSVLRIDKDTVIDFNGHSISNSENIWDTSLGNYGVIVIDGCNVTLKGEGSIVAKYDDCFAVDVVHDGTFTVDGNILFSGNVTAVQCAKGKVTLNNGEYEIQALNLTEGREYAFVLNCIDKAYRDGTAVMEVVGGKYHNFNPADNLAEGENTNYVPDGYVSTEISEGLYEVTQI